MASQIPYLDVQNLTKRFGAQVLFDNISFSIAEGQKVGLVARNGTGKSTLMSVLMDKEGHESGDIIYRRDLKVGYLEQSPQFDPEESVLQACFNHEDDPEKVLKAKQILTQLHITNLEQPMGQLSGGQQKRVALANVLITEPDFLMLDEPTNHMDIPARETLESAFRVYKGTMLFISHDRYFIEQVADALLIFENGQVSYYPFGYRHYMERLERMKQYRAAGVSEEDAAVVLGQMSAEDQALIAGLKNVPKGATLLGHELSTDQAFLDWQLRLAAEAMAEAAEKVENYYHSVKKTKQEEWEKWIEQVCDDEVGSSDVKELISVDENLYPESVGSQVDDVLEQWYKSCLDWYDIWEEMHPQVLDHKEEYPDAELTMKLHEAEEAVKNEKAWLSLDELKNQVEQ